jgi:hypothetical protein
MHVEKRLKRLWVRIGETLKRLRSTNAGRWWRVWVSGGRKWVLGSSKAVNYVIMRPVRPYLTPALTALHLGSQAPPLFSSEDPSPEEWGYIGLYAWIG